ncbi:hypothetical protein [Sphingobacterium hungaricum]|uniref:Uncharacterized protein n=1 Tax=Sphingobacterium hungaricum TaxID=2082723 RepID=A0A928YPJ7_9SPHI|nr:hypothetical protein [Sphingobacterium hungaricum]MBE8712587.1 hypothetical protein [Sphingobacterium hungaricum]
MKAFNLFVICSLIICSSCKKDSPNSNTSVLKLEFVAGSTIQNSSSSTDEVIATLNIKSYNAHTGELIFDNIGREQLEEAIAQGSKVNVYATGDSPLFTLKVASSLLSVLYNEPVLYYSLIDNSMIDGATTEKNKWYILSGYSTGKILASETITNPEQLANFKKIEANWDLFIDELKRTGRYIN